MESDRKSTTLDLIVKFGGAAITDKSSLETLKPDQLDYGASIIEECYKLGQTVVVVHGAGYGVLGVCARVACSLRALSGLQEENNDSQPSKTTTHMCTH
ncbi:hypothetical protein C0Q70_10021 [Pomacea canaliculata]|uniref:Aspartate/glutamate/uridylate kinase domain-containing protein n=1 Tax=Pomacea canaliculata TaxID=400727 RepID=A0A2T7PBF7_POMCA|nr:hypothetical protein C0Q70_10021 [Pomacea canaliculata]